MTNWILALGLIVIVLPCNGIAQSKEALVGTWKLVSATDTTDKGEGKDAYGRNPSGFLTYTADGRVMAIITNGGRKPLSTPDWIAAPAEERAAAFATVVAYAGRYSITGDKITHHVEITMVQNIVNTDLVRFIVRFDANNVILRTSPFLKGGVQIANEKLVWERVKSEIGSQ